jgi:hypothetical protein
MRFDLRWKAALGLGVLDHGCDHTSICVFRTRLLAHEEEGRLFRQIVSKAVEAGLLTKRAVQVMDSSPMLGAAAVQDTYKLIRTALHKLVKAHENKLPKELRPRLKRYVNSGKPKIDWNDAGARKAELKQLVEDAELALAKLPVLVGRTTVNAARELLKRVAKQDVEADGEGGMKIRQGVAKDRVISTVDPDARHGHKSSAGKWDGYKKHVSVEPESELITAVEVTAASVGDGQVALGLLTQQAASGLAPKTVVADMAYAGAELRAQAETLGEGTTLLTKAAAMGDTGWIPKSEFKVDLERGTVTCPAGAVANFHFRQGHSADAVFSATTCSACPLASSCVKTPGTGRTVNIHPYEDHLQAARMRRSESDFDDLMRKRPTVERKQAHLNAKGGRRSRYFGVNKVRLQTLWSAAMVNIERLMVLGAAVTAPCMVATAPA